MPSINTIVVGWFASDG